MAAVQPAEESARRRDLAVIGASAGSVEMLRELAGDRPTHLAAAVCIVPELAV